MNCLPNEIATDLGCIPDTPAGFAQKYFQVGLGMIGGVSFFGMVYGMILVGTSQGNNIQIQKGKKIVTSSIIGLLLAIFSVLITRLIASDILHIPGF
ncbi:MAG: hypothetical protein WCY28_02275 [Candidatus Shapirobacteria bacterium]|jgi:hypothetical protein